MSKRAYYASVFLGLLSACQGSGAASLNQAEPAPKTPTAIEDTRSQYDFAKAWAAIDKLEDEDEKNKQGLALASKWQGRVYHWYGYFLPGLCFANKESCFAKIFDRKKTESPDSLGGFMPEIRFTKEGYAAMREGCKGKVVCIVHFQGTLSEVRTDPTMPLGFTFTNASVEKTRDILPEEQWSKEPLTLPADFAQKKPRIDPNDPIAPNLNLVPKQVF